MTEVPFIDIAVESTTGAAGASNLHGGSLVIVARVVLDLHDLRLLHRQRLLKPASMIEDGYAPLG